MAQFDQAARYLIRRAPLSFFRWVVPRFLGRWHFRGFRDTSTVAFPGEPDRVCDTVAEFHEIGRPRQRCLVDAEAQAQRMWTCWTGWANTRTGCAVNCATAAAAGANTPC
jgi:hypothetical protein